MAKKTKEERHLAITELLKAGKTQNEIVKMATEFEVSETTIRNDFKEISTLVPEGEEKPKEGNEESKETPNEAKYVVPEGEEKLYHVEIEKERWNEGKKLSKPFIQKFEPQMFDLFKKHPQGHKIQKILHSPKK